MPQRAMRGWWTVLLERMRTGRSDAGTSGKARHARHFPPENATNDTWQYVRCNSISTDKTVFLSLLAGETRLCPDKSPMLRRANAHQLPVGRGHCLTKARCSLCRRGHKPTQRVTTAVADNALIDRQMTVLPVVPAGQVKPLIRSVPRYYPPPLLCRPRLL